MVCGFNNGFTSGANRYNSQVTSILPSGITQNLSLVVTMPKNRVQNSISSLAMTGTLRSDPVNDPVKQLERELLKQQKEQEEIIAKLEETSKKVDILQRKKREYLNGGSLGIFKASESFKETTIRSAVKAFLWRIVAGSVTFYTAFTFSKSIQAALSIVASDFLSKVITMFIGERLMNESQAGRSGGGDNMRRSLAKALIWRLFAICNTLVAGLLFAKDLKIASKIAGSDAIFKTFLMFAYERAWANVNWGKEYEPDFYI